MDIIEFSKYVGDLRKLRDMLKDVKCHVDQMHCITYEEADAIYNVSSDMFNKMLEVATEVDELCKELF